MVKINYATRFPRTFAARISREGDWNENETENETETENERKTNSRQLNQFQHGVGPVSRTFPCLPAAAYPAISCRILAYPGQANGHARTLRKRQSKKRKTPTGSSNWTRIDDDDDDDGVTDAIAHPNDSEGCPPKGQICQVASVTFVWKYN